MIRSLKLFTDCVESLRTAEKAYEEDSTAARKRIVTDLQNKVDGWINSQGFTSKKDTIKKQKSFGGLRIIPYLCKKFDGYG